MTTDRTARENRASTQKSVAQVLDANRASLGIDQHEVATAIGASESYVRKLLNRSDGTTVDVADLLLMSADHKCRPLGEALLRHLASQYGLRVVAEESSSTNPVMSAAELGAHASALTRDVIVAAPDGFDAAERERIEAGLRVVENSLAATRAAVKGFHDA